MEKKLNQISLSKNKLDKKKMENTKGGNAYGNGPGCGDFACSGLGEASAMASFAAWRAADNYDCIGII